MMQTMNVSSTNRLHFPAKIYLILENESPDIVRWHNNNKAFRIVDHQRFEREIIPKYFRHNQMSSVQRQLNLYGFRCVSRGEDKGSFYHPKFRRGDWDHAKSIRRSASHTPLGLQHWKVTDDMKGFDDDKVFEDDLNIVSDAHSTVSDDCDHTTGNTVTSSSNNNVTGMIRTNPSQMISSSSSSQRSMQQSTTSSHPMHHYPFAYPHPMHQYHSTMQQQQQQPVHHAAPVANNGSHNTTMKKQAEWTYPSAYVIEQQRSANTTIARAFNNNDLAKDLNQATTSSAAAVTSTAVTSTAPSTAPSTIPYDASKVQPLAARLGYRWNLHQEDLSFAPPQSTSSNQTFRDFDVDPFTSNYGDSLFDPSGLGAKAFPNDTFEELIEMCQDLDSFLEDCESATVW